MSESCVPCTDANQSLTAFGQRVRALRQSAGMRQADLAAHAGLTRASIANLEAGRQNTTVEALTLIADALDSTVGALLGEQPGPNIPSSLLVRIADQQRRITSALADMADALVVLAASAEELERQFAELAS